MRHDNKGKYLRSGGKRKRPRQTQSTTSRPDHVAVETGALASALRQPVLFSAKRPKFVSAMPRALRRVSWFLVRKRPWNVVGGTLVLLLESCR
jgi:hypothetical protein